MDLEESIVYSILIVTIIVLLYIGFTKFLIPTLFALGIIGAMMGLGLIIYGITNIGKRGNN